MVTSTKINVWQPLYLVIAVGVSAILVFIGMILGLGLGIGLHSSKQTLILFTTTTTTVATPSNVIIIIPIIQTVTTNTITTIPTTGALSCSLQWNSVGTTVAGDGNGAADVTLNRLRSPNDVTLDSSNTLYIADTGNHRIQRWVVGATNGSTVAGQADGTLGNGLNQLNSPAGVVIDSSGNIYVADTGNNRVQSWSSGAAQGTSIVNTTLNAPSRITRNANTGILYVSDRANNRAVQIDPTTSAITRVAGSDAGGNALNQLNSPNGIFFDSTSNSLVIANSEAHNIVRWVIGATTGTVLAGTTGTSGNTATLLNNPTGVTLDSMGNIYVADTGNHRIQFFRAGQTVGTTIAGTGTADIGASSLSSPSAVSLDNQGNLYVADTNNNRIQKFTCIQA